MNEYQAMWKNYVNFRERTTVRGFWMAILFNLIVGVVLSFLSRIVGFLAILSYLYSLAALIPGLALSVRRLHDINKSGWWVFLSLVPFVGAIILIIWCCQPSVEENNQYGSVQV